jgi:hypothetical protein
MDEVVPGVWIGDLQSALDVKGLKERNIFSIVTAMRGKVTIHAVRTTSASSPQVPVPQYPPVYGSEADTDANTSRHLTSTKSTLTIVQMKMSSCTFYHQYHLSRTSSTRVVVYSCTAGLESVRSSLTD